MAADGRTALTLRDGTRLPVRPIRAEDAAALQRLVGRSSDRSVELRFFGPLKELTDQMARRFADLDGVDRFALVALDPEDHDEIVGVVRYGREEGTDGAEYAALIEDRFQHRGLGVGLTRRLVEAARQNGIKHLFAMVRRENAGMLSLLRSLDLPERMHWQNGIGHLHALVLRENAGMLSLLRSLDLPERVRWQDGAERVEIELVE